VQPLIAHGGIKSKPETGSLGGFALSPSLKCVCPKPYPDTMYAGLEKAGRFW